MLDEWSAMSMAQTLVVTAVAAMVVQCMRLLLSYRAKLIFFNSLPGEHEFSWIRGSLRKFRHMRTEERLRYFLGLTAKYPKFWRVWFGPFKPSILLHHPDTMRALLRTADRLQMHDCLDLRWA